ncbi:ParB/RepB/Spo0J family partition protein [Raoultibacter timonensis]|uniref:Chromosome partitioning protein ParB n=1 Tax=Raoultibacter timonensis TaxID=1907662 RepID=A0ABN6MAR6_9ACTN|nr:ParB/RepB/Spo0J family partition protein [Raoultibacter timonensis]BDE94674.1 chromosome partitioning protein ParB [Raoultibacter timonensis]BDF49277.1 chromosome partitioning protein ParB [Raoultibacter timonensis]
MAKQNKSGLGRGLNSLLSGSMEEAIPAEAVPSKQRTMVTVDEELPTPAPTQKPAQKPTPAKQPLSERQIVKESEPVAEKVQDTAAPEKSQPYLEEEDHVTIKSVVAREVKDKRVDEVELTSIEPNPDQPRTNFKQEEIEELASSIEKDGLLQPILVRSMANGKYQIIAGERRWQACRSLGLKTVPIRIKEADDDKALELALIENIQRSDLNPIEEAYGYRRLMERQNMTQSEVAQAVSKGRSTIANSLRLLELPEDAQQLLFEEKISAGHARAILSIPSKEGRQKLTEKMVQEKISVREAETLARLFAGKKEKGENAARIPTPKMFKSVARALRESFNTNVRVKTVQGKNKIEIEFKDEEELERLFETMTAYKKDQAEQ